MRSNKIGLLALTTMVLAASGVSVLAQVNPPAAPAGGGGQGGGGGQRGGRGRITLSSLTLDTMDYGLKLTPAQKTQIKTIIDTKDTQTKALPAMPAFVPGQPPADPQAMQEAMQKRRDINTTADTAITAVLTDDQKAKMPDFMKELTAMQGAGIPAPILGSLKLTDAQKTKITALAAANQEKQAAARAAGQRMTPEDRAAYQKDVSDVLTPTQHTMVDKYMKDHPAPVRGNRPPAAPPAPAPGT